jgi:hypothetical protein
MVYLVRTLFILVFLFGTGAAQIPAQDPPATENNAAFFSGTVSDVTSSRLTVSRNHLGKNESRSFAITQETKVEGKLRVNARVTVRFRTADEGDVALHIIVRGTQASRNRD